MVELKATHVEVTPTGGPVCFIYPNDCPTAYELRPATGFIQVKGAGGTWKEVKLLDHPGMTIQQIVDVFNQGNVQFCQSAGGGITTDLNQDFITSNGGGSAAFDVANPLNGWTQPAGGDDGDTLRVFFSNGQANFKKEAGVWELKEFEPASEVITKPKTYFLDSDIGNGATGLRTRRGRPFSVVNLIKNHADFQPDDIVELLPGNYAMNNTGAYEADALANDGQLINFHFHQGAVITNAADYTFGLGRWDNFKTGTVKITGHGKLLTTGRIPIAFYGNQLVNVLEMDEIIQTGNQWLAQISSKNSIIRVKKILINGAAGNTGTAMVYGSWSNTGDPGGWCRIFEAYNVEINAGKTCLVRFQGSTGGSNSKDYAYIRNAIYTGNNGGGNVNGSTLRVDVKGTNDDYFFKADNVLNLRTGVTLNSDTNYLSNNSKPSEIDFNGGSAMNTRVLVELGNVKTTQSIHRFAGHHFKDESQINVEVKNGYTNGPNALVFAEPTLLNNSHYRFKGNLIQDSLQSVILIHARPSIGGGVGLDASSSIKVEGYFKTTGAGTPVIRINGGVNEFFTPNFFFENAEFINDGVTHLVTGTLATNGAVLKFKNCKTNTVVFSDQANYTWEGDLEMNGVQWIDMLLNDSGAGSPEGVLAAPVGSQWIQTDGGAATVLWIKETGTGNTGWISK